VERIATIFVSAWIPAPDSTSPIKIEPLVILVIVRVVPEILPVATPVTLPYTKFILIEDTVWETETVYVLVYT
jgi:hypothetical protein